MKEIKKVIRCAIYTRKSTEEGLEQDFNSLDAQREACEAYIKSQQHEGWILIEKHFDDGGFSGGTLERPGVKELFKDIEAGEVDIVVVYKVDRLTRSLMDFSKIVELFDKQNASFVSITQHFNTTTSMGRLTLNILLSFAQFEREVTGERIRDKIAASKKKGMWMGGCPPLGYRGKDKKLVIYENEAEKVKLIFNKYLELKSVAKLKEYLSAKNICTNSGKNFSKGNLYKLLENKIYVGLIIHKDKSYNGEHEAIISDIIFEKVRQQLYENRVDKFKDTKSPSNSLLVGKIFDDKNNRMTTSHSNTRNRKYRYYVSQAITKSTKEKAGSLTKISAGEIESFVVTAIKNELSNLNQIQKYISDSELGEQKSILQICKDTKLYENKLFVRSILTSVTISKDKVVIVLCQNNLIKNLKVLANGHSNFEEASNNTKTPIMIERFIKLAKVSKSNNILILDLNKPNKFIQNNYLINAIVKSHYWNKLILDGKAKTAIDIQKLEGLKDPTYIRDVLNLKFLPPQITEMIFNGTQPPELSIQDLFKASIIKTLI